PSFLADTCASAFYALSLHDALPIWLMRKGDGTVYCVPPCNSPMVSAMRAGGCRPASAPQRLASTGLAVSGRNQFISRAQMPPVRSEEHTSELQSREKLVCRLLLENK